MRIALFGQSGPFAGAGCAALLARLPPGWQVVLVVEAPGRKRAPQRGWLWGLAQPRPATGARRHCWDLEQAKEACGARYVWCRHGDDRRMQAALRASRCDIGITIGFPFRLSAATLAAAGGVLNAHPSALPRFRGPCPLFWWLRSGEQVAACTVHLMTERFDEGPILLQRPMVPPLLASGEELLVLAGEAAAEALLAALQRWQAGHRTGRPQTGSPGPNARVPRAEDGHVQPAAWSALALARFFAGAPHFVTPSFVLGRQRFFVADGGPAPSWQLGADGVPGDFVQVGKRLWMGAQDGVVACDVQI